MRIAVAAAAVLGILVAEGGWAQGVELSAERVLEVARETMVGARYCFLVTLDSTGQPQARVMDPFEPEPDLAVWMGTNAGTRKVSQLREDRRAALAYYDSSRMSYVTLIGSVRLVDELEERRRRWKPGWEPFYSEGPESDDYILLEFVPSRIEVMSFTHGVGADPSGFAPAILDRRGSRWILRRGS